MFGRAWVMCAALLASFTGRACAEEAIEVPVKEIGQRFRLVGELGRELGSLVTIEGQFVDEKIIDSRPSLRVRRINGRATQLDIEIPVRPIPGREFGDEQHLLNNERVVQEIVGGFPMLPALERDQFYELRGYETGGYEGYVMGSTPVAGQHRAYGFLNFFVVCEGKEIGLEEFHPSEFKGRAALLEGTAENIDGGARMVSEDWQVLVNEKEPWPAEIRGKLIETYGMYNPADGLDNRVCRLVDGVWRLVRLEDQVGRDVELRGTPRSLNGHWFFNYRGAKIYVEKLDEIAGNRQFKPTLIRGKLEQAELPSLDQISHKADRDLVRQFIVRGATAKPIDALLAPERP